MEADLERERKRERWRRRRWWRGERKRKRMIEKRVDTNRRMEEYENGCKIKNEEEEKKRKEKKKRRIPCFQGHPPPRQFEPLHQ